MSVQYCIDILAVKSAIITGKKEVARFTVQEDLLKILKIIYRNTRYNVRDNRFSKYYIQNNQRSNQDYIV